MTASEKIESSALAIETNLSSASQIPLSLISRYCWRELPEKRWEFCSFVADVRWQYFFKQNRDILQENHKWCSYPSKWCSSQQQCSLRWCQSRIQSRDLTLSTDSASKPMFWDATSWEDMSSECRHSVSSPSSDISPFLFLHILNEKWSFPWVNCFISVLWTKRSSAACKRLRRCFRSWIRTKRWRWQATIVEYITSPERLDLHQAPDSASEEVRSRFQTCRHRLRFRGVCILGAFEERM